MRALRALFKKAVERGFVKESLYPFKKYKISGLRGKGLKGALDFEEIIHIVNVDLRNHPHLVDTRNCFVLCFYTRGMNFADMICLEWKELMDMTISIYFHYFFVKIIPRRNLTIENINVRSLQ